MSSSPYLHGLVVNRIGDNLPQDLSAVFEKVEKSGKFKDDVEAGKIGRLQIT